MAPAQPGTCMLRPCRLLACRHVYVDVYMDVYIHMHICIYVYICIYIYIYIYIRGLSLWFPRLWLVDSLVPVDQWLWLRFCLKA